MTQKKPAFIAAATALTLLVPAIGYVSFGVWPALLFLIGYLGGFIGWLVTPSLTSYERIRIPYWTTFILFIGHRIEEKITGFFQVLSDMTSVPIPDAASPAIILLLVFSVAAWICGPFLLKRRHELGYYLMWTFFVSMGVTELAHFVLPFFRPETYWYFPGMISVIFLAPSAWFSIARLTRNIR